MSELSLSGLIRAFNSQWADESGYVGMLIDADGIREVIIDERKNFESKLKYYTKSYNENLTHKYADEIKIVGYTFGDSFAEIENNLLR